MDNNSLQADIQLALVRVSVALHPVSSRSGYAILQSFNKESEIDIAMGKQHAFLHSSATNSPMVTMGRLISTPKLPLPLDEMLSLIHI